MKKKFFRGLIVLLCCCMLPILSACSDSSNGESAPSGMQLAVCQGADFRLYIPTHWSVNTGYGVSGGYYSLGRQSTVSVAKYEVTDEMESSLPSTDSDDAVQARADWFYDQKLEPQTELLATGGVTTYSENQIAVLLDGVNARQYHVSATVDGEKIHFVYVVGERDRAFYVLSFLVTNDLYEALLDDYLNMLSAFRFATPYEAMGEEKQLEDAAGGAPDGMKIASNSDVAYLFYVPEDWQVNVREEIFAAYTADRSVVSIVPYMPGSGEAMNIPEYFEWNADQMRKTSPDGFELLNEDGELGMLGGSAAMRYEYLYTVGGVQYRYLQVITAYRGMFYNLTYAALPQNYQAHLDDVNAIIEAFSFR